MIPYFSLQRSTKSELFDLLPPIAAEAAYAIHANTGGVDEGLIRAQMIAVMAAAIAPLYRIRMPSWKPIPLQVPVICVGRSGVSKTPVFLLLHSPFERFESKRDSDFENECKEHEVASALRALRVVELKRLILKKKKSGEDWKDAEEEHNSLLRALPQPKHRGRRANMVDYERLVHLLDGNNEAIDFLLNEGDQQIDSLLFRRHAGSFNDIYDGPTRLEPPQQRRKQVSAKNPNISFLFLLRESALGAFLPKERNGEPKKAKLVDLGFFARFLICIVDQLPRVSGLWAPEDPDAAIAAFNQRLYEMLELHHARLVVGDASRIELQLDPSAVGFWDHLCQGVRSQRARGTSPIDEHLGKLETLTARLAAIFHVLESDSNLVSLSALQRAWQVVSFHIQHYERAFAPPPPPKQAEQDMLAVVNLLREKLFGAKDGDCRISVKACAVRLGVSERRVLHVASILEDRGQVSFIANGQAIDFRNLMRFTSCISRRI